MAFGKEIKRIKLNQKLTAGRLAEILGVNQDRLTKWMQKDLDPKEEDVSKIEKSLGMSLKEAMRLDRLPIVQKVPNSALKVIPYYANVNASAGLNFITNNEIKAFETIAIPSVDADAFINVFGDSMYPRYLSGQIIGVKQIDKEYVMFGHAYVIQMKDGEAYLKYIKKGRDENHWILDNENKNYDPREFHLSKIEKVFIIKAIITKTTL